MTRGRDFLWPSAFLVLAVFSFAIRSGLGIPVLSGTWIRSIVTMEPFGFSVTGLGPWYDGSWGWPLLTAIVLVLISALVVLSRDQNPLFAYAVFILLGIASVPTWAFPLSLLVPIALMGLPVIALIVTWQVFRKGPHSYSQASQLRAAYVLSLFSLVLAGLDWAMVFLVGGK
jgi:hypothetical protein